MWRPVLCRWNKLQEYFIPLVHKHFSVRNHCVTFSSVHRNYPCVVQSKRLITSEAGEIALNEPYITINRGPNLKLLKISSLWLRDHCRCPECYNYQTNQRRYSMLDVCQNIAVKEYALQDGSLKITWTDNHCSNYTLDWLSKYCDENKLDSCPLLWNKHNINSVNIKSINMKDFMNTEEGLVDLLSSLVNFGVGFVENVPPTLKATEQVVQRISHVQRTFFGDMWEFSDSLEYKDTAYTSDALGAHTDTTYFSEAAGLQVLHCLHHDGDGGETLLVDGFHAANCLKQKHPECYTRLTERVIESEYREEGKHYLASGPLLKLSPLTGELEQIRFNLYDRAPMKSILCEDIQQFYEDLILLSTFISNPAAEWWLKLRPGTILFFNNWRVLHGRAAYTGHRIISGCYIGHSDWCSKARILGLL